jgi:hypothetical protein
MPTESYSNSGLIIREHSGSLRLLLTSPRTAGAAP